MENYFTPSEIEIAKNYKYNGTDDSIAVKLFLRHYWDWLIEFVPLNIPPNTITFIGFLFEVFSFLVSAIFSYGFHEALPGPICILNGICLFIYQTLDNLDGRQARRTGMSSPLGQFFDHGCDAITGVLEMMKVGASLSLLCNSFMFQIVFLMSIGFYITSWQEYSTGSFYLGVLNGPDEGLLFLSILHIIVGFIREVGEIANYSLFKICFDLSMIITIGFILYDVYNKSKADPSKITPALLSLCPFLVSCILLIINYVKMPTKESSSFIFLTGLLIEFQGQQLIVGHLVGRDPFKQIDFSIYVLWALLIVPLFQEMKNWYWIFLCFVLFGFVIFFDFRVILGLSHGLNIPVFTVVPKNESEIDGNFEVEILDIPEEEQPDLVDDPVSENSLQ